MKTYEDTQTIKAPVVVHKLIMQCVYCFYHVITTELQVFLKDILAFFYNCANYNCMNQILLDRFHINRT